MSTSMPAEFEVAVRLLQQALGTAGRVVELTPVVDGHQDVEIVRDDAPPIPLRLRPWHTLFTADGGMRRKHAEAGFRVVWIAGKRSRRLQDGLRDEGVNFISLNGSVRVVAGGLILDRSNLPRVPSPAPAPRRVDPFADRNSLIARILLDEPGRRWGVREIAAEAELSPGTVSQVVRALSAIWGIEVHRHGRNVDVWIDDPMPLLRRWTGAYSWERNHVVAFAPPMGDPLSFLYRTERGFRARRWGLTLQAGASLVAPHAAWERVHLYVDVETVRELHEIAEAEGWPPAEDGRLVLMKPHYRHSVWHGLRMVEDLPVVSDVQLVLDLWHYPLRGIEQAEHLLSTARLRER